MCCDQLSSPKGDVATRREGRLGGLTDLVVRWPQWQGRGHGEAAATLRPCMVTGQRL